MLMLALLSAGWTSVLQAHGLPRSIHGGKTATALDLGFEIFQRGQEVVVYVTDHDSPFSTDVFSGHVEIQRNVITLKSAPGGLMVGKTLNKKLDFSQSMVVLTADVLSTPLRIDFKPTPH